MVSTLNSSENNHVTYRTLNELVTALSEVESTLYSDIIHSMKIPSSVFEYCCSWSNKSYTRNCFVEKLTATLQCSIPVSSHDFDCLQAVARTHSPIVPISPEYSATDINSYGGTRPVSGPSHLMRASTPLIFPVSVFIFG